MWHNIHTNLMQNGTGVQAILRFCLKNLRGCNFRILMGRIYDYAFGIGSGAIHTKFRKDCFKYSEVVRGNTHTDTLTAR
jgi:hypothetical protein